MALLSIIAVLVAAVISTMTKIRAHDPVLAAGAARSIRRGAGIAVEIGTFALRMMSHIDPQGPRKPQRFGRPALELEEAVDDDD